MSKSDLNNAFQASKGYIVRPCLNMVVVVNSSRVSLRQRAGTVGKRTYSVTMRI